MQAGNIHTWKCSPSPAALLPAGAAGGTGTGVLPAGIPGASWRWKEQKPDRIMLPVERMCFQSFYFTLCSLNWGSQRWVGFPAAASPLILGIPSKAGAQLLPGSLHKEPPGIQKLHSEIQALSCSLKELEMGHQDDLHCALHFNQSQGHERYKRWNDT